MVIMIFIVYLFFKIIFNVYEYLYIFIYVCVLFVFIEVRSVRFFGVVGIGCNEFLCEFWELSLCIL